MVRKVMHGLLCNCSSSAVSDLLDRQIVMTHVATSRQHTLHTKADYTDYEGQGYYSLITGVNIYTT